MKKVILTAAAALALFATTFAQSTTAPAPKAKPATETPATQGTPAAEAGKVKGQAKSKARGEDRAQGQGGLKALGLSPEQETQFKTLNQAHKAAVKAVQSDASLASDAKKSQVATLVSKYQSDVQGMMNADQFAKWTAARAKRADKKMDGGNHKGGDHKMDAPAEGTAAPKKGDKKNKKEHN